MNRDYRCAFRVFVEGGGLVKGFDTMKAANVWARGHMKLNRGCGAIRIEQRGVVVATLARDAKKGAVWTDLMQGMKPPQRLVAA